MKLKALFVVRLFNGLFLLSLIWGAVSCASVPRQTNTGNELNTIQDINVSDLPDKTEITVVGQKPLVYTSYQLTDPSRLIVDLAGASVGNFKDRISIGQGAVTDLLPIEGEQPSNVVRLEITLSESVLSHVRADEEKLVIDIDKPVVAAGTEQTAQPASPAPTEAARETAVPPAPAAEEATIPAAAMVPPAKTISKIDVATSNDELTVVLTADGSLKPDAFLVDGNRLVLDLPEVKNAIHPNVISVKSKLVKRIRIGQHTNPQKVRVVFDLTQKASYSVEPSDKQVAVVLSPAEPVKAAAPAASTETKAEEAQPEAAPVPEKQTPPAEEKAAETAMEKPAKKEAAQLPPALKASAGYSIAVSKEKGDLTPKKHYVGRKISLDFQDADISNVLRLLADVSGFNIVIGDDVKGKVTLKLINVPWDQALDIVLKMNNLGQIRDGNIIRVATTANITKQQDEEAQAKEAKLKAEDLVTRVIYVNYSKAEELGATIKKSLSPRGTITIDKRTNTLIVKDIQKVVDDAALLARTLDTRTPEVQIEARIVQADTNFAQSLGIQWGIGFSTIQSNNVFGLQGINTGSGVTPPPFGTFAPDFAVNLPATVSGMNAVPSMGFNFGRLTDSPINLDLRLSAGELNGVTKVISSPKVTTLDNGKATIHQGESIPFQTSSANTGPTTTFVDADLSLEVTPHITPDESIIMLVKTTRNNIGAFSGPAGPSIAKREATTQVLVRNGETTVIGGIFVNENSKTESGLPLLSKIPILGWLFKSESKHDNKSELLIFITPNIVRN